VEDVVTSFTSDLTGRRNRHERYVVLMSFTDDGLLYKMLSSFCKLFVHI